MSQPHEPTPGADPAGTEQGGAGRIGGAGDASGRTEPLPAASEPTPAAAADQPTVQQGPGQPEAASTAAFASEPPPGYAGGPPGRYVFVPAGATVRTRRFGPAFGQFARNRATQLVAAVVVGAVIGGGTVAIVDNATHHNQPTRTFFRPGGGFENGNQPGFRYYLPGG